MLLLLLHAVFVYSQNCITWCGKPECPPKPKCSNSEVDLIIALDESCSMTSSDFDKQKQFAAALASATEKAFNVTRFSGVVFGFSLSGGYNPQTQPAARVFQPMQPGAALFNSSLNSLGAFSCGGTPTDEALSWFYSELNQTLIPGRMQMAVLSTDGIPTLCYTTTAACHGTNNSADTISAANAAIAQRFAPNKLPSLGSLMLTVGIGGSLSATTGATQRYGDITGRQLLQNFASSPRLALLATNFSALISVTLAQVVDSLCYYVIDVVQPAQGTCYTSGTNFVIKGYNMFSMGTPLCRWQQVGTQNYLYTNATIDVTNDTYGNEIGVIGLVSCSAPLVNVDFNAYLEVSREGKYYTSNQYSVLIRSNCSAPLTLTCPNATIAAVFSDCNVIDFQGNCSSACSQASNDLAASFQAQGMYPAFTAQQITDCISNYSSSLTSAEKQVIISRSASGQSPCVVPPTSVANVVAASFCLIALFSLALS